MPYEHETKFVVSLDTLPDWVSRLPGVTLSKVENLHQVYLKDGLRLRQTTPVHGDDLTVTHIMAYKKRTACGPIEIETSISEDDFYALVEGEPKIVRKERYTFHHAPTGLDLELDIYADARGHVFLRVIEVEHEASDVIRLVQIMKLLGDHLVLRVDPNDSRFANQRLADPYYAIGLAHVTYQT